MKSKLKKILLLSTTSILSLSTVVAASTLGLSGNQKNNTISSVDRHSQKNGNQVLFDPNKPIIYNGKQYHNLYAAIEEFMGVAGNVDEKMYLGNVSDALVSNNTTNGYDIINVNKLKPYDHTKLKKAYKLLSDEYSTSQLDAKISYVDNYNSIVPHYSDNNGRIFDSESEALASIQKNVKTSSIAYYEVLNHAKLDGLNKPTVEKINPLNKQDLESLKSIAIDNVFIPNSGFDIKRYALPKKGLINRTADSNTYVESNYKGFTGIEVTNKTNEIVKEMMDIIKRNLWYNVGITATVDPAKNSFPTKSYSAPNDKFKWWNVKAYYNVLYDGRAITSSPKRGDYKPLSKTVKASYSTIVNDVKRLFTKNGVSSVFDIVYPHDTPYIRDYFIPNDIIGWKPLNNTIQWSTAAAQMKKGESLFGHKDLFVSPEFDNYWKVLNGRVWRENVGQPDKIINFQGLGSHTNVYFGVDLNQDHLVNVKDSSEWQSNINNTIAAFDAYVKKEFESLEFTTQEINDFLSVVRNPIKEIMSKSIIPKSLIGVTAAKDESVMMMKLENQLSKIIYDELQVQLEKLGSKYKTLYSIVNEQVKSKYVSSEQNTNNDVFYAITYNNAPLFKIDNSIFSNIYSYDEFRGEPLKAVKNKIKELIYSNNSNDLKKVFDSLTNISNSFDPNKSDFSKNHIVPRMSINSIADYNNGNNKINLTRLTNYNVTDSKFESKYMSKFINEDIFSKFQITTNEFQTNLKRYENDDIALLNSSFGTLEAIRQYNRTLFSYLKKPHATTIQKDELDKNMIVDANDIVNLFDASGNPATIRYSEYFDNDYKFNIPLNNSKAKLLSSIEEKDNYLKVMQLNKPTKIYIIRDKNGQILNKGNGNELTNNDGFATSKEQAYINALNAVDVKEDLSKIFYIENDGTETLMDNVVTKLNVLNITSNGVKHEYGFLKYDDMYNYLSQYIKLNSQNVNGGGEVVDSIIVPFDANNINLDTIRRELSGVDDVNLINELPNEIKFQRFGAAFNIPDLNKWLMYIGNLNFAPTKKRNAKEKQYVDMTVTLNPGFKFADNSDVLKMNIDYDKIGTIVGDDNDSASRQAKMGTVISISASIISIIILEVILITTIALNKKKNEIDDEVKLMKLIK